ncbi:MAG: addiction module protein [Roseimicrobium sp.]
MTAGTLILDAFRRLPVSEQIRVAEDMWDEVEQHMADQPVPDWQEDELRMRKASLHECPPKGVSWETLKQRLTDGNGDT